MAVLKRTIILEDVLAEMFKYLPDVASIGDVVAKFPVVFGYGDEVDLNQFLANRETSVTYPLIWLLYPYEEEHTRTNLQISNATFIFAVETNSSMENFERIQKMYKTILMPLLHNFKLLFERANVINTSGEYKVVKHPNFSKTDARDEGVTISVWDALKVKTDFTVIDTCLKEIKF